MVTDSKSIGDADHNRLTLTTRNVLTTKKGAKDEAGERKKGV